MTAPKALLAKIHVAKKQLALDDGSYRAILARVTGRDSAADCSERQLEDVVAEFKRLGWTAKPKTARTSDKQYVRKIYALWAEAGRCGAVRNASTEALRAFVARQTNRSAPEFCGPTEANKVSEGLKAMIARAHQ